MGDAPDDVTFRKSPVEVQRLTETQDNIGRFSRKASLPHDDPSLCRNARSASGNPGSPAIQAFHFRSQPLCRRMKTQPQPGRNLEMQAFHGRPGTDPDPADPSSCQAFDQGGPFTDHFFPLRFRKQIQPEAGRESVISFPRF
jgi:hypothetical protein